MENPVKKAFWKSKTILFNAVAALAALLPQLEQALPVVVALLPPPYYAVLSGVVVVGNIILRGVTDVGIALKDQDAFH